MKTINFLIIKLSENNPYLLVAVGDFNAKLSYWYSETLILLREFQLKMSVSVWIASNNKGTYAYY